MEKPTSTRKRPAKPAKPAKTKRASRFGPEIKDEIVRRISLGETLRQICREPGMPSWWTVYDWLDKDKELASRFARARELGEDAILADCMDIADNATNDWMEVHGKDDVAYKVNGEHVQRSKLRIWTRMELLKRWNPKKWGDKVDLNHGVQPDNPLASLIQRVAGSGLPIKADEDR